MCALQKIFGYNFNNPELLDEALTHPSYKHISNVMKDYNRLEFLGDSVLNLAISDLIFEKHSDIPEGELSILHSALVNKSQLAKLAKENGIHEMIKMDHGEAKNGGRENKNNLEDALEAILGAIFLDSDYYVVKVIVKSIWQEALDHDSIKKDDKSALQEWLQQNHRTLPVYTVVSKTGAAHQPYFTIELEIHEGIKFRESSNVKKEAEFKAARAALEFIHKNYTKQNKN